MAIWKFCGALDFDGGVHSDLHAGVVFDWGWDELVAGGVDDLFGEFDCAGADDPECACGHEVWDSVSGVLPGGVWDLGGECAGVDAGAGGVRLVWDSDVDWGQCDLQDSGCFCAVDGGGRGDADVRNHSGAVGVFFVFLGDQSVGDPSGDRYDSGFVEHQGATADHAGVGAVGVGVS